ncbi:hypothetical protein OAL90_00670 [Hyphomicrobiales bacterium]|nr:hypothetical protein [Hyphomicrobiales bacterium]
MKKLLLIFIFFLTSCSTPYQSLGLSGGVESNQINSNTFEIRAAGNGFTRAGVIKDYSYLKAAELCISNGFDEFKIIERDKFEIKTPLAGYISCNNGNCYTEETPPAIKPNYNITVEMFKVVPQLGIYAVTPKNILVDEKIHYDCSLIKKNLISKYIK